MKLTTKLWIGIILLILLSPLGLILPAYFHSGSAWGEWKKLSALWRAPIPDYAFKGWEEKGLGHLSLAYIISALAGVAVTVLVVLVIGKVIKFVRKD